jgi:hypothetical protein
MAEHEQRLQIVAVWRQLAADCVIGWRKKLGSRTHLVVIIRWAFA